MLEFQTSTRIKDAKFDPYFTYLIKSRHGKELVQFAALVLRHHGEYFEPSDICKIAEIQRLITREERLATYVELDQLEATVHQLQKTMENMRNINIRSMK